MRWLTTVEVLLVAVVLSAWSGAAQPGEIQCYACNSYMAQCKDRVDNSKGSIFRAHCASRCFIRHGEDNAIYRGCFDGFIEVETLSYDYLGCRNQTWNNRSLLWCVCNTTLCNGESLDAIAHRYRHLNPDLTAQPPPRYIPPPPTSPPARHPPASPSSVDRRTGPVRQHPVSVETVVLTPSVQVHKAADDRADDVSPRSRSASRPAAAGSQSARPRPAIDRRNNAKSGVEGPEENFQAISTNEPVSRTSSNEELQDRNSDFVEEVEVDGGGVYEINHRVFRSVDGQDDGVDGGLEVQDNRVEGPVEVDGSLLLPPQDDWTVMEEEKIFFGDSKEGDAEVGRDAQQPGPYYEDIPLDGVMHMSRDGIATTVPCPVTGYYQHPHDCRVFLACVLDPNGVTPIMHLMLCPSGLWWDDMRKLCVASSTTCPTSPPSNNAIYRQHVVDDNSDPYRMNKPYYEDDSDTYRMDGELNSMYDYYSELPELEQELQELKRNDVIPTEQT